MGKTFRPGDRVVCILNNRASLTVGNEYVVQKSYDDFDDMITFFEDTGHIDIISDSGDLVSYRKERFMSLAEFRDLKIRQVNNHIKKSQDDNS